MKRHYHYVKSTKGAEFPQQCIWFDTESLMTMDDPKKVPANEITWLNSHLDFSPLPGTSVYHYLKLGFACYMRRHRNGVWTDEEWLRFTTIGEFWEWVCARVREKTKLYLLCHNTSFDVPVLNLLSELPARGYTLKSAIIEAPPTVMRYSNGSKCIMILDTLNIFRMPLKILGEEIGLNKGEFPEDNALGVTWDTYGRRDVEIIRDACIKWWTFLEQNDMGSFAPTLAGQAMKVFRHKYMAHKIFIDADENALKLTREGYYGGRVECFHIGRIRSKCTLLDVNSMYPSVMAKERFPVKLVSYTRRSTPHDLSIWMRSHSVTARCLLRTRTSFAPIRNGNKLVFPTGTFTAILSTPELHYALADEEIIEVYEAAVYQHEYIFHDMMIDLYNRRNLARDSGDKVTAFMWRKILNSFYGKWGQAGGKWTEERNINDLSCKRWVEIDAETGRIYHHRQLGGLRQVKDIEPESRDSFPAIAAHITAYARMELFNLIRTAGIEHTHYCDTDSLLVDDVGRRNLQPFIDNRTLGKLGVKGEYSDVTIWGAKDYVFGEVSKCKGARKDAVWEDDYNLHQTRWAGLRGLIASGFTDRPVTSRVRKHLTRAYDKGKVLSTGEVLPFHLMTDTLNLTP